MISINLTLFVQMAVFLVVLVILNRLLFQPILHTLDERARRVEAAEARARALEAETAKRIAAYEKQLEEARAAGVKAQEQLRKSGAEEGERLLRKMREESGDRLGELRERIARDYSEASATLKAGAEALSREVVVRILGRAVH